MGTIREGTGGFERRTLDGDLQANLAGSGNADVDGMKTFIREITGANLGPNVMDALDKGDTTGAIAEVGLEMLGPIGDFGKSMFIGFKRAMKSGANTVEGMQLMQKAIDMEDAGKSAKVIKQELNMHRGPEGAWRKEISDAESAISKSMPLPPEGVRKFDRSAGTYRFANKEAMPRLDEVFVHDKLYAEYPELRDVKVALLSPKDSANGVMFLSDGVIGLNPRILGDDQKMRGVILHEMQHQIQAWEGFIGGAGIAPAAKKKLTEAKIELEFLQQEYPELREISTLGLETMMRYTDENYAFTKQPEKIKEVIRKFGPKYIKAKDGLDKAFNDYLRVYGEAEARSTQYSANFPDDMRKILDPMTERNDPRAITDGRFLDEKKRKL